MPLYFSRQLRPGHISQLPLGKSECCINTSAGLDMSPSLWPWHSVYRFRWDQSPGGDRRALLCAVPTVARAECCVLCTCLSVAALSPFQLFAPSFYLFLSEGVDFGSRSTSDQHVINEAQYFSSKKLWRDSRKARIWLSFQKPGCRKKTPLRSLYYYLGYFFPPFGSRLQCQKVSTYSCYWAKTIPGTNLLLLIGLGL